MCRVVRSGTVDLAEAEEMKRETYFHGSLPRENVAGILVAEGEFLVRYNDKDANRGFVVCVRWADKVRHYKVSVHNDGTFFVRRAQSFRSVRELVNYHVGMSAPISDVETTKGPVKLVRAAPRSRWELRHQDIKMEKKIGEGAFGEVWIGKLHKAAQWSPVAIKTCKETGLAARSQFEKEAMFQFKFKHPHIVGTLGMVTLEEPVLLVLEFLGKGSLLSQLRKAAKKEEPPAVEALVAYCLGACRGMEYLESQRCIHRDLATRNCLVGDDDTVKISDFGLAKSCEKYKMLVGKLAVKWMAPESMRLGEFTCKSDVWSYAVLCWEVFSGGAEPYPGLKGASVKAFVLEKKGHPEMPAAVPEPLRSLMLKSWEPSPNDRPSFAQILAKLAPAASSAPAPTPAPASAAKPAPAAKA